jgi:hypothetical protein
MKVVQVCLLHFFKDMDIGVMTCLSDLQSKQELRDLFIRRFQRVYPN